MSVAGVILAGGRARRMGGRVKALQSVCGKPLLGHVIDRVGPQVAGLSLSVEHVSESFEPFGLPQLADEKPGGGPLGGLLAAMKWMDLASNWLLLVPCDAPFVPTDLGDRLLSSATASGKPGALVRYEGEIQPVFSIWHRSILPVLEQAVSGDGLAGFKQFLCRVSLAEENWPTETPPPFFNINDQEALSQAEWLINMNPGGPKCAV